MTKLAGLPRCGKTSFPLSFWLIVVPIGTAPAFLRLNGPTACGNHKLVSFSVALIATLSALPQMMRNTLCDGHSSAAVSLSWDFHLQPVGFGGVPVLSQTPSRV